MSRDLPPTALAAYAELLDLCLAAPPSGRGVSVLSREKSGRRYWYVQWVIGSRKTEFYLGPDSREIRDRVERVRRQRADERLAAENRERLVAVIRAAGGNHPTAAESRVVEALAQAGIFLAGGVLVGTQAFLAIGNALGRRWGGAAVRTQDIDIARDASLAVNVPANASVAEALRESGLDFFAVPALDARRPSTSFTIRGAALRVDVLTPMIGRPSNRPVVVPGINAAATPVRFLDFLLEDHHPAVVAAGKGTLIEVPAPARFAVHKLVVSRRRPAAYRAKASKDIEQATAIIEALLDDSPHDLRRALRASSAMPARFGQQLRAAVKALPPPLRDRVEDLV